MEGLSKYNPAWDQSRRARADAEGYVLASDGVLLATDFECANGHNIRQSGPDSFEIDLEPEPGDHRYGGLSYYYCFGVANLGPKVRRVRVALHSYMGDIETGIGEGTAHAIVRRGSGWGQLPLENVRSVGDGNSLELTVDLPPADDPNPVLFLSDFHWHPHTEMVQWVTGLSGDSGVRVSVAGTSVAGRDLYRLDLGSEESDAPTIVMAQTPQPSEGIGSWACRRIVDFLLSGDETAADMLKQFRVVVIPATNPDGTVEGLGVSHPSGRFPYFEGKKTADEEPDALPEMKTVWDVLKQEKPWLFIEWHGNNWRRRPGHMLLRYRPSLMQDTARRQVWEDIDRRLEAIPDTYHGSWTSWEEGIYQQTIGFMAVTRLQAIAYMIKPHDSFPLEACTEHALRCVRAAMAAGQRISRGP